METNAERRKRKLKILCGEYSVQKVAELADLNPASLRQILNGTLLPPKADGSRSPRALGDEAARSIESAFGFPHGWFDTADDGLVSKRDSFVPAKTPLHKNVDERVASRNVQPVTSTLRLPVLQWHEVERRRAGMYLEPERRMKFVEAGDFGRASFILVVDNNTMESDGPISFPMGSQIVVDPERADTVRSGDFVIARDPQTMAATFKQLLHDAGRWYLRPLNTTFPVTEIPSLDGYIIGRVMQLMQTKDV